MIQQVTLYCVSCTHDPICTLRVCYVTVHWQLNLLRQPNVNNLYMQQFAFKQADLCMLMSTQLNTRPDTRIIEHRPSWYRAAIQNTGWLHKCQDHMLFQRSFVLLIGRCKVSDGISKIVFINACQCLPKPSVAVQEKGWCGADVKLHHQSLHTANPSAHMTVTCQRL